MARTGYKIVTYLDDNPYSPTYMETYEVREYDDVTCPTSEDDWVLITDQCEVVLTGYTGYRIRIYYNETTDSYREEKELASDCTKSTDEIWVNYGEGYCEVGDDGLYTGYFIQPQRQTNQNLPNYGEIRNQRIFDPNCTEDIIGIGTEGNDKISVDTTSTLNANVADNIIDNSPIAPTVTVKSLAEYLIDYMPIASYPENTTLYRLGLYAAAESDTYENYGFEVSVDGANPANIEATKYGSAINVVVGDETKEISASGLNYDGSNNTCVFGQIISFPAEYNGANRITFRPYVVENGEYKYGYKFTLPMLYTK